jgi:hypothetical protein
MEICIQILESWIAFKESKSSGHTGKKPEIGNLSILRIFCSLDKQYPHFIPWEKRKSRP